MNRRCTLAHVPTNYEKHNTVVQNVQAPGGHEDKQAHIWMRSYPVNNRKVYRTKMIGGGSGTRYPLRK